tara:strand:+ start:404 stop:610 length:207 start_codon:yes stop_codon:yes gene_type:complete
MYSLSPQKMPSVNPQTVQSLVFFLSIKTIKNVKNNAKKHQNDLIMVHLCSTINQAQLKRRPKLWVIEQ